MSDVNTTVNEIVKKEREDKMPEKKAVRNPFPMIGKVYKYEFKNLSRKVFPLFVGMIVLGLCLGLTAPALRSLDKNNMRFVVKDYEARQAGLEGLVNDVHIEVETVDDSEEEEVSFYSRTQTVFFVLLIVALSLITFVTWILIIFFIDKRMKKGFLEDEAYFNFTLPVTMGEHITGRFLVYLTMFILWALALGIALFLCFIKYFSGSFFKLVYYGMRELFVVHGIFDSLPQFFGLMFLSYVVFYVLFVSFIFVEKSIDMLFIKHKVLAELLIEIPLIVFWIRGMIKIGNGLGFQGFTLAVIINLILPAINLVFGAIVYKKRINIM